MIEKRLVKCTYIVIYYSAEQGLFYVVEGEVLLFIHEEEWIARAFYEAY